MGISPNLPEWTPASDVVEGRIVDTGTRFFTAGGRRVCVVQYELSTTGGPLVIDARQTVLASELKRAKKGDHVRIEHVGKQLALDGAHEYETFVVQVTP